MLLDYAVKKALDAALPKLAKLLKTFDAKLRSTKIDAEAALANHLHSIGVWSSEVSFVDLRSPKELPEIFVEPDFFVSPLRHRVSRAEAVTRLRLTEVFGDLTRRHVILLGQPGAGKTTSLKYLAHLLLTDPSFAERFNCPILVKLRDLNRYTSAQSQSSLFDQIQEILNIDIDDSETRPESGKMNLRRSAVVSLLDGIGCLLLLDGFDELASTEHREVVLDDIRYLANHLTHSSLIVTSRTGEFYWSLENTAQYELSLFDNEQVARFVQKWLVSPIDTRDFLSQLQESPFTDTARRPLTLAHLCAIFERLGRIPERPRTVYHKIVSLLLEDWDRQRSVRRRSRYARFEIDRKLDFLCHVAYELVIRGRPTGFSKRDFLQVYDAIYRRYHLVSPKPLTSRAKSRVTRG